MAGPGLSNAPAAVWNSVQIGIAASDRGLYYMMLPITARLEILYRTDEETFSTTVSKANNQRPCACAINGIQYSLSTAGYASVTLGSGPIAASDTTPDGLLIRNGSVIGGRSAPGMFYLSYDVLGGYTFGAGDPPLKSSRGIGGLGPIIIDGLPYGVGNLCKRPANCPPQGPVPPAMAGYMTQRNNATYAAQQGKSVGTGKAVLATNKSEGRLLVCVQPQGSSGMDFDSLKQWLLEIGCDNAVFLDGSDSVMLHANGDFKVRPGSRKDRTNTVGLAFYL